jgi:hypothetical protein
VTGISQLRVHRFRGRAGRRSHQSDPRNFDVMPASEPFAVGSLHCWTSKNDVESIHAVGNDARQQQAGLDDGDRVEGRADPVTERRAGQLRLAPLITPPAMSKAALRTGRCARRMRFGSGSRGIGTGTDDSAVAFIPHSVCLQTQTRKRKWQRQWIRGVKLLR